MNIRTLLTLLSLLTVSWSSAITVTTTRDEFGVPSSGPEISLREAIRDAMSGDTIDFDSSLSGQTLILTGGTHLVINKDLTIDASSLPGGFTIDANAQSRILEIQPNSTVALHGLTLTGGVATGAFPADSGGAIYADGSGPGNFVQLSLHACTLFGNSADRLGGGILSYGESGNAVLSLSSCTLFGNSATFGGGIFSNGSVAGNAELSLSSCTLSENSANLGGGIFSDGSSSGNATLNLTNTILASNTAPTGPDLRETGNARTTATDNNLMSSSDGHNAIDGEAIIIGDPLLSPLGYYGGSTQTMHPLAESPAINQGGTSTPRGTDQRGFARFNNGALDIGAVEVGRITLVNLNSDLDLREAISSASTQGAVIQFAPTLNGRTITLTSGQLTIPSSTNCLFIDASNLTNGLTIDANASDDVRRRVMFVAPDAAAALHGLTLRGGWSNDGVDVAGNEGGANGGGIFVGNRSALTLCSTTISHNLTGLGLRSFDRGGYGGGVFLGTSANLTLHSCTISENQTQGDLTEGGGIYTRDGTLTINNSSISQNMTLGDFAEGGGIYNQDGTLTIDNSSISQNMTLGDVAEGGGIYNQAGTLTINNSSISENQTQGSSSDGGGIYNLNGTFTINNSSISENQTQGSSADGGGIYSSTQLIGTITTTLSNCTISGNDAVNGDGGGYFNFNGPTVINHCTIAHNSALSGAGVASFGDDFTRSEIIHSIVQDNTGGNDLDLTAGSTNSFILTNNLIGSTGPEINNTSVNPEPIRLAPLGDYGGPTQTMPPLPGSPAIDAGGTTNPGGTDQRGFTRLVGAMLDIGAVEIQVGEIVTSTFPFPTESFHLDDDQDGTPNGLEFILGTDYLTPDSASSNNPALSLDTNGHLNLRFGKLTDLPSGITLRILRSETLATNSFTEIGTYDSSSNTTGGILTGSGDSFTIDTNGSLEEFSFTDTNQPDPKAFYRLEATYSQP